MAAEARGASRYCTLSYLNHSKAQNGAAARGTKFPKPKVNSKVPYLA